mgnify:CR=1 FL=1
MNKFLPMSRQEMEERKIEQMDFVYVTGDATWITRLLALLSSAVCWRAEDIRWE